MTRRRDPYSCTVVRLPERDLSEVVLDFASPLLTRLGASPPIDSERIALELAVSFWNASVLASKLWEYPRVKELNELKKRLRGRQAAREDAATFDLLTELLSLEPYGSGLDKQPLLIHMPSFNEESIKETPVLELYAAGVRFRKALETLIREAATGRVAPAEVDKFIAYIDDQDFSRVARYTIRHVERVAGS